MSTQAVLAELKALGTEKQRAYAASKGAGENQFGVKMGDIRKVAKGLKKDDALARKLWATGNIEAQLVTTLIVKPKSLEVDELDEMVQSVSYHWLQDWLMNYVVKKHPEKEVLRQRWMKARAKSAAARAGWALTAERVAKDPDGLDLDKLLDTLEAKMGKAEEVRQWTMNICLAEIGIHHPEHRERAIAIGEKLGVFRDLKVPKGCTSPYAPVWIEKMVGQQG